MPSVELTPAPAPEETAAALEFCVVPIGGQLCPIVSGASVTTSDGSQTRMCPTHAFIASDIDDDAEVIWDAPATQPLAVALYEQHHRHLDGQLGEVDGKSGGAL